jgi:hypothetical protein
MSGTGKLCPCASGKLYEQCCGKERVLYSLDQARWRRASRNLRRSLGEFADQPFFAWDAAKAQDLYLGSLDEYLVDHDDDFTMERCFEWFVFDYELSNGQTIIETFLEERLASLGYWEGVLLKEWVRTRISLYEVIEIIPGRGVVLKELLKPGKITVRDLNAVNEVKVGNIVLIRVLKVGQEYEFSTSGLALPEFCKEPVLKWLRRSRQEYIRQKGRKAATRSWAAYLKEKAHIINARAMELGVAETPEEKIGTGKNMLVARSILPVTSWQPIMQKIDHAASFRVVRVLRDKSGAFKQAVAAILGAPPRRPEVEAGVRDVMNKGGGEAGLRPVQGLLVLTPRFVIINASNPELVFKCRELVLGCFKSEIKEDNDERDRDWYSWPEPGYAVVAGSVRDGLESLGYNPKQQKGALKLWFDYCSKERPSIRKAEVWTATVIYTFTRLEMADKLKQEDLAGRYGVSSSTISSRFRLFCRSLNLVTYDCRYATKEPSPSGVRRCRPLGTKS